jgi:endonuclease YncB( thermonuclease family)
MDMDIDFSMEEKPKSNVLRILLIVLGVLVGCCLVCWASSFVLGQVGGVEIERFATQLVGTLAQATIVAPPTLGPDNELFASFETPSPTSVDTPTSAPTLFEPSATATAEAPAAAGCVPQGERVRALVIKILGGDSIQVVIREQTRLVKYIGARSPRLGIDSEPFAIEAAILNRSLVENQVVTLVSDASDLDESGQYLLRYVISGDTFVNDEILRRGYAQTESLPSNTACQARFAQSQKIAMEGRLGMWADLVPTPLPGTPTLTVVVPTVVAVTCDCRGADLQCESFATRADAQACFDSCKAQGFGDVFLMDMNKNGLACENISP